MVWHLEIRHSFTSEKRDRALVQRLSAAIIGVKQDGKLHAVDDGFDLMRELFRSQRIFSSVEQMCCIGMSKIKKSENIISVHLCKMQ